MKKEELEGKIKNIYIMLLFSIIKEDINRVKQYLSDALYERYKKLIEDNIYRNIIQRYDELNIQDVVITGIDNDIIHAYIDVEYIDYITDRKTKKFISGDNRRSSRIVYLTIKHNKENREEVYRCSSWGAPLNINLTGNCPYCNAALDDSESEYVIVEIE